MDRVEVRHTHISVVFLAGGHAYKIKKPVDLGFLDFTTLEKRRHFCEEEVRLNRRLAPTVYLGVVPVTRTGDAVESEGTGEVVEWAVKMERLPERRRCGQRLRRARPARSRWQRSPARWPRSMRLPKPGDGLAAFGRFPVVAGNARENFDQAAPQVGTTISRAVFDRFETADGRSAGRWRH